MQVVHLNSFAGKGGAARAAERLSMALNRAGHKSEILYLADFLPKNISNFKRCTASNN